MTIFNTVNPILMHFFTFSPFILHYFAQQISAVSNVKPDVSQWKATWRNKSGFSDSILPDLLSQIFDIIQADVVFY